MRVLGLALAIAILAAAGCARAGTPMSMAAFRDAYTAEVHHRRPDAKVEAVAPDQLSIGFRAEGRSPRCSTTPMTTTVRTRRSCGPC